MDKVTSLLVIGSGGLLGSAITQLLANRHPDILVTGFDLAESAAGTVRFVQGNVTSLDDLRRGMAGIDTVINTVSVVDFNPRNNVWMESINIQGAKNVLQACEELGVDRLIHTSSMDVVYEGLPISEGDESLPYASHFLDHYSYTKQVAERHILEADSPVAKCALRAAGLYGENDNVRFPAIIEALKSGKYARLGDGKSKYSHVYAGNCAFAHVLAALALEKGGKLDGQAYFVVDGSTENFNDFVAKVLRAAGLEPPTRVVPAVLAMTLAHISEFWIKMPWVPAATQPTLTRLGVANISQDFWFTSERAQADFGYAPAYSTEEAIERTATWIKQRFSG